MGSEGRLRSSEEATEGTDPDAAARRRNRAVARHLGEDRLRALAEHALDLIIIMEPGGTITWISPAVRSVLGYDAADVAGRLAASFVHPEDRADVLTLFQGILQAPRASDSGICRVRHADGSWCTVEATVTNHVATPSVEGVVLNLSDVTDRLQAHRDAGLLADLLEATTDLVCIIEPAGGVVYLNDASRRFLDLAPEVDLRSVTTDRLSDAWSGRRWDDEVAPALQRHGTWSGEVMVTDGDGRPLPLSTVLISHCNADGDIEVLSSISRNIADRKAFESTLEHQASHDPLTGLPNRTLLGDRLHAALGRAQRHRMSVAVLFCDLDRFKVVNDSLGHALGDRLLEAVARRLTSHVRPGDTVARFGGDEFVVLCEGLDGDQEARAIADRIAAALAEPMEIGGTEVVVTSSIGIAVAHGGDVPAGDLLRDADAAMYQAKGRGRARTELFDSRMRARAVDRLELESDLRRAVDRRELRVLYQPYRDLRTNRIAGAEALLRWEHPERGLLLPGEFLAVAEETRLILPIGQWVLGHACRVQQRAAALLPNAEPLTVSVNLSARQLAHPGLVRDVAEALSSSGCDPSHLDLEITENVLMDDVAITTAVLRELKALGVTLAVDDFGTGYSSLAYLRRFPVDVLKVDRAFVAGLSDYGEDTAIVAAVVNLAHTLGLEAVAEGVEAEAQLDELRRLDCDLAQGFLIGRPMPDENLFELLGSASLAR